MRRGSLDRAPWLLWALAASRLLAWTAGGCGGAAKGDAGGVADAAASVDASGADAACGCLQHGSWRIDNIQPCFVSTAASGSTTGAISTIMSGQQDQCPTDFETVPPEPWSTDTLTADCPGHYQLCYTLKAGSAADPKPTDCIVAQSCAEGDYATANQSQPWPTLPAWRAAGDQITCAQTFVQTGGYGEESVTGTPSGCASTSKVLSRVTYCPLACNGPSPPASCSDCVAGGGGAF